MTKRMICLTPFALAILMSPVANLPAQDGKADKPVKAIIIADEGVLGGEKALAVLLVEISESVEKPLSDAFRKGAKFVVTITAKTKLERLHDGKRTPARPEDLRKGTNVEISQIGLVQLSRPGMFTPGAVLIVPAIIKKDEEEAKERDLLPVQAPPAKAKPIEAIGTLAPANSVWVYAPIDGIVKAWHCKSGESVQECQKIATVASAAMESRLDQLRADIHIRKDKIAVLTKAIEGAPIAEKPQFELSRASDRIALEAKSNELSHLNGIYKGGAIVSPLAGTVIIASPEELLGKLVTPTAPIFRVAQAKGDWHANVWFAEKDVGRLLRLLHGAKDKSAPVDLLVAAFPEQVFKGALHLEDVAAQVTVREKKTVLHARVRISEESLNELRILPIDASVRVRVAGDR